VRCLRFDYERRYHRRGVLIECRWFLLRFYPPILPSWTFWRKATRAAAPEEK
jgi:hypothetical protein